MTEETEAAEVATCPIPLDQLDAAVLRNAGDKAPAPLRMMTARGMAPMPPKDMVTAQFVLTFDADEKVQKAAAKSLSNLDERIANAVLSETSLNPHVLAFLAKALAVNDTYAEKILLNPTTPSNAFIEVSLICSEAICEIIANNQARLLEEPEIARSLTQNGNALKSTIDRVIDFLVRNSVLLEGLKEFEDALMRLTGEERMKAAESVELPPELFEKRHPHDDDEEEEEEGSERQLIEEDEDGGDLSEEEGRNIDQLIRSLTAGQKVALASRGNRQHRSVLLRDTNRIVALAAITAPAVSESEIIGAAQSRTVHADVVGHIMRDKKNNWVRIYAVKLALVQNPKTLLPDAMRLVPTLNKRDLKMISKSKNVPMGVRNQATRRLKISMGGKG